jgi:hypothetical protein
MQKNLVIFFVFISFYTDKLLKYMRTKVSKDKKSSMICLIGKCQFILKLKGEVSLTTKNLLCLISSEPLNYRVIICYYNKYNTPMCQKSSFCVLEKSPVIV